MFAQAKADNAVIHGVTTVIDADGKTLERELAPLDAIRDHNPKYLLTMDYGPMVSHNGIRQINVLDWLTR